MCLNDYIGVKGCDEDAPESGLYVNDVPGITTKLAANIVDTELISGERLLKSVRDRAYIAVVDDIISAIAKYGYVWIPQQVMYNFGGQQTTSVWSAGREWSISPCVCEIQSAHIAKIKVNAVEAGTLTINGTEYEIEQGISEIEMHADVDDVVISADVDLHMWKDGEICSSCGYELTPVDIELSVICSKCKIAEIYRDTLKNAFMLKAGILFYQYALTTEQTSQEARHAQSIAGRMLAQLKGGIDKDGLQFHGEYKQEIENITHMFKNIAAKYPCCFDCGSFTLMYAKL